MIFEVAQSSFTLTSRWSCNYNTQSNGSKVWKISSGPTQTSTTIGFEISLPADAKITRSWIEVELGSPLSGAKVRTINGDSLPSTGLYEISNISASTVYWTATFVFKANGKVFEDLYEHSASLSYGTPTLRIEYTSDSGGSSDKDNPTILPGGTLIREKNGGLQLPRLLKADLSEERRLYPSRCSITLNLHPLHTATMYLNTLQEPGLITGQIPVRSFVELFTPIGSAGIFRVTDTDITYGNGEGQTLYLESALNTLKDDLVIGVQAMTGKVVKNLIDIYSACTNKAPQDVVKEFEGKGYGDFKMAVGEAVVSVLKPLQDEVARLEKDKAYIDGIIKNNAEKANYYAMKTLRKVQKKVGFPERIR